MTTWMHVIHLRGGDKAAWARLNKDQDVRALNAHPESEELDDELLDL